jgi:hypothetical protein
MKKELIDKLLNEQTTPEEEHLIAQELRQKEDIERWLIEDETALYDSIVAKRQAKRRYLRWAIAAVIVTLLISGATLLWPQQASDPQMATTSNVILNNQPNDTKQQPLLPPTEIQQPVPPKAKKKAVKRRQTSATDSLNYYIARLEKELENVNESTYNTKAEEVLRADARLQKLVQRIMIGELTKDNVPAEALNTNQTMEEQP